MQNEQMAEILHSLFCTGAHSTDMSEFLTTQNSDKCYWYCEEVLPDCWNYSAHIYWLLIAVKFISAAKDKNMYIEEVMLDLKQIISFSTRYGADVLKIIINILKEDCECRGG